MWILAAFIISLKLDWGQQLANPIFLGTMIIVFFLMGLNLYGVFEIGTSMTSVGGELQGKKGYSGSFFSGALTTLVATPCSGPFLGAVMAFALSQDNKVIQFAVFTVFGLGIASPYILLSFFPALIKKLPRPGAWMETFKQVMAFFVFATAVFFMKGYLKLVGDDHFNVFLFALCLIGLGVYMYGRYGNQAITKTKRYVTGFGLAGLMTVGGIAWAYSTAKPPEPGLAWNEWYPGIMEQSRSKKRIIWVDYTADW
jgi:thiol:disulfide interchange protein DsbD